MPTLKDFTRKHGVRDITSTANPMDIMVGGAAPPTIDDDFLVRAKQQIDEDNRPWTPIDALKRAEETYTREPQRLGDILKSGFVDNNAAFNLYKWVDEQVTGGYDPTFNMRDNQDLYKDIPADMIHRFNDATDRASAENIRDNIMQHLDAQRRLSDAGAVGTGAALVAGLVDLDSLLPMTKIIGAERAFMAASKARRVLATAKLGAAAAAVTEPILAATSPTGDWSHVPASILASGVFAGTLGGAAEYIRKLQPGLSISDASRLASQDVDRAANRALLDEEEILGAHIPDHLANSVNDSMREVSKDVLRSAEEAIPETSNNYVGHTVFGGEEATLSERASAAASQVKNTDMSKLPQWLQSFKKVVDKSDWADDFNRLVNSGSDTGKMLGHTLFESAEGTAERFVTGAMTKHMLTNKGLNRFLPEWNDAMKTWAKDNNFSWSDTHLKDTASKAYSREVQSAINEINYGRADIADYHPEVQRGIKAVENIGDFLRKEAAGPTAAQAVPGFETLQKEGIYMHRRWDATAVRNEAHRLGNGDFKAGKDELGKRIGEAIHQSAGGNMTPEDADMFGKAVVNRMIEKGTGMDTNLKSYLMGDGVELARDMLAANGVAKEHIDEFLNRMTGVREDAGKVGAARARLPLDLSLDIRGTKMQDLIDGDMAKVVHGYSEEMTNRIALSRNGIKSRSQIENIKNTILKEIIEKGSNPTGIDRKFLDYVFSYFESGPIGEGVNPTVRRLRSLTNLSLLSKISLAQLGETGGVVHSVGVRNFMAANQTLRNLANGNTKIGEEVVKDLGYMTGNLGYERSLIRQDVLDEVRARDLSSTGSLMQSIDSALAKGRDLQGELSGFYRIMEEQTKIASLAITNRIFTALRDGERINGKLADIGLGKQEAQLKSLINRGIVQFNEKGYLDKLGREKWSPELEEAFSAAITRHAYQVVQKTLPGESMHFMHESSLALITHLKDYPITAIRKQAVRALINGEASSLAAFSLGTAALAATVGYAADGHYDKINPVDVSRRAFGMSNITGWIPEFYDPLAHLTGLPQFNPAGGRSGTSNLPSLDTLGRITGIPKALVKPMVGGGYTAEDARSLKALPVLGNFLGMARLWEAGIPEKPAHDE